jgi:hypothetical protein
LSSVRGDEVRRRRRETIQERLHGLLLRRRQEHNAPGRGELLPQRVPHPPGRRRSEEARHAVRRVARRSGRAGRRERCGCRERGGGSGAEGARDDPGVAEPREGARPEEAVRAATPLARRGAEAAVHGRRVGGIEMGSRVANLESSAGLLVAIWERREGG